MSFEPANLFTCDSNYYLIYLLQSIHAETSLVGAVNTRRFNSGYTCSNSIHPSLYRRNRSLVKSTSGLARSHSRFSFEHGSRILQYCSRKIRALYAKVHFNLSRKVQPLWSRTLVINWQLNWLLANLLTESASSSKLQLYSLEQKIQFHYNV